MRWLKRLLYKVASLVAVIGLIMTLVFFAMSQPESSPDRAPVPAYANAGLDGFVGLYDFEGQKRVLVTYSASGGLALYGINGSRFSRADYLSSSFIPAETGGFRWQPLDDAPPRFVTRIIDKGRVSAFTWEQDGIDKRAHRRPAGFSQVELTWKNGAVSLSGTAFIPENRPHAGAVILHGSGTSDRDNLWYLHFALRLAEDGVAVLLPDKRGSGKSGGDWRRASFEDFARDGLIGRTELSRHAGLPEAQVGFVGMSQGGSSVAPYALSLVGDLPFVVNVSGSTVPAKAQLDHETYQNLRQMGIPAAFDFIMHPYAMAIAMRKRKIWWNINGDYDPMPDLERASVPLLVIYGRDDEYDNVPVAASVKRLESLADKRDDVVVRVFDGVGHGLFDPDTREVVDDVFTLVTDWVLRFGSRPVRVTALPQALSSSTLE